MKKLLLKLITVLSLPVILSYLYVLIFPDYYMNTDQTAWMWQKDHVTGNSDHNDIIIMGDSCAQSGILPYDKDGLNVYNLSIFSCTSVEMYISLRNYLENHDAPQAVVMMFSVKNYFPHDWLYEDRIYEYTFSTEYYSVSEAYELYKKGRELDDPIWGSYNILFNILNYYYLKNPVIFLPALNNGNFFGRYDANKWQYEYLEQNKGWMSWGNEAESYANDYIAGLKHFNVMPMQDYYLRQMIELCRENDIKIVIEQPPAKESSIGNIPENVINEFEGYFTQLQQDYPYAFINTSLTYYSNDNFTDADHLNLRGAEKLTAEIFDKYF